MTARDFCFWLQGFFEIRDAQEGGRGLDAIQTAIVRKHLALVFKHEIDPSMGPPEHQAELDKIHHAAKPQTKEEITALIEKSLDELRKELQKKLDEHNKRPHARPNPGGLIMRC